MSRQHDRRGTWTIALVIAVLAVAGIAGLAVAVQDEFEPNDSRQSAAAIDAGTYEDLEVPSDGIDYYAVDLEAGQQIDVTVRFTHEDGDIDARLYPPGEDSRFVREGSSSTDDEELSYTAEENGTHYVQVYGYDYHSNTYSMEVETGPVPGDGSGDQQGSSGSSDAEDGSDDDSGGEDGGSDTTLLLALGGVAVAGVGYSVYRNA